MRIDLFTILCTIEMASGEVFKIRSFVKNAKLIEVNERLTENP